jgi:hypothetical protein
MGHPLLTTLITSLLPPLSFPGVVALIDLKSLELGEMFTASTTLVWLGSI